MISSIHQPNYIPYLWLFNKIYQSDVFVFYDNAQYTKWDYHNRNTVKWPNWPVLLSLPVHVSLWQKINEVTFNNEILTKHWMTIEQAYKRAPFFWEYAELIKRNIFENKEKNLAKFNINTIKFLCEILWIKTKLLVLSELIPSLESKSTQALVDICLKINSDVYISWAWWKNYVERDLFRNNNIKLLFQEFKHPIYHQIWNNFIPYMSILDLIFNEWENSINFINWVNLSNL